jgi:ketosteroid isomerase-like protein
MTPRDLILRWYATRDPELLSEGIAWSVLPSFPGGGVYHGREAVQNFFAKLLPHFTAFKAVPQGFIADGNQVAVTGDYIVSPVAGDPMSSTAFRFAHIFTVEGGKITAFEQIADTAAVQAAMSGSTDKAPA